MASTNKTDNYELSQFEGSDQLTRADYNADMLAIDTAIKAIADISTGGPFELQKSSTHIQWRYVGETTWIDIVALADITGATGATGAAGTNGTNGTNGTDGADGADGRGITSIIRTSGDGSAGTTDTYTITFTDSTTTTFQVVNGADGAGAGDMLEAAWAAAGAIKVEKGGTGATTAAGALTNLGALGTSGNGSSVTAAFTTAGARADINTGETLATLFGKLKKWYADLKALAWLDTVGTSQIDNNAVTLAKIATQANGTLLGNVSGSTAVPSALTATQVRTLLNVEDGATADMTGAEIRAALEISTLSGSNTGDQTLSGLGGLPIAGGTMTGALVAQNNTNYTTAQARNITLSTADPSGGGNGDVWIKYTA